ncbi:hypothetical protein GMOD_00008308 [Pyrenophora seminiperda CCB06]|uniref:Uncharacterized protein n=1 Tax=Pyrenophora seminiperda CCB06 TaxID=1302712 RepID=A0A3M7M276_9PLEO|nr:hypothetical protein GMOD_00008308 [Pyrenophora seminiperda CCB06]
MKYWMLPLIIGRIDLTFGFKATVERLGAELSDMTSRYSTYAELKTTSPKVFYTLPERWPAANTHTRKQNLTFRPLLTPSSCT